MRINTIQQLTFLSRVAQSTVYFSGQRMGAAMQAKVRSVLAEGQVDRGDLVKVQVKVQVNVQVKIQVKAHGGKVHRALFKRHSGMIRSDQVKVKISGAALSEVALISSEVVPVGQ